jgi:crotonobetainyl-CoA:carnitine CoA-transferase CaiB-like acyl-CoA transferase
VSDRPSVDMFGGVRVVELAQWVFVPVAGALLADWGADVLKIEHPEGGDGYRGLMSQGIGPSGGGVNLAMEMANRGKRSVAIDLKTADGRAALLRIVADADVFLTNFLPGALDRLGLGVDDLRAVNPRLIYARGHGYGVRGPDADSPAYDATAFWARGGLGETLSPQGLPEPIPQRGAVGDRNAAVQLAFGISAALFRRERTGEGSVIDVSLLATAMWMLTSDVLSATQGSFRPTPAMDGDRVLPPNPLTANYQCADGRWLALCCLQPDRYWRDLCEVIDRPDLAADPRFADITVRTEHRDACIEALTETFARHTLAEWKDRLVGSRIPWAPFQRVDDLLEDRQVVANGYVATVERDGLEPYRLPTGAVQFDETPAAVRAAPELGAHTDDVLLAAGYSWDEIIDLKTKGSVL